MKKKIPFIILALLLFAACSNRNTATTPSSDPTVIGFAFRANDSIPGLAAASFTIEEGADTGRIYNVDSIAYGTAITKVVPSLSFNHTPKAAIFFCAEDTISWQGSDTLDFTLRPTLLHIIAEDAVTDKWYKIFVNVHQVDPDLYVWEKVADEVFPVAGAEQKAFWFDNEIQLFVNDGIRSRLYQSPNGESWVEQVINGLPDDCLVRNILAGGNELYYAEGKTIYHSADAVTWQQETLAMDYSILNMLIYFRDSLWAVAMADDSEELYMMVSGDGLQWAAVDQLTEDYPISDFSATTFISRTGRERAMIVGGFSLSGAPLNCRWNLEYSPERQYRWTNFSTEHTVFPAITGAAIIEYGSRFLLFGGADSDNQINPYPALESIDEGMHWSEPDSIHFNLPDSYQTRTKQSVVIDDNKNLYIIGGQSRVEVFSDVYRGRLNSIDWD